MTGLVYRREDLASLIVLLLRVAKNADNDKYEDFDEQLAFYNDLVDDGPEANPFLQNVRLIFDAREHDSELAGLMDTARDAIGAVLTRMVQKQRWHNCAVIDRRHVAELARLAIANGLAKAVAPKKAKASPPAGA
jgi:hypothetical protein